MPYFNVLDFKLAPFELFRLFLGNSIAFQWLNSNEGNFQAIIEKPREWRLVRDVEALKMEINH